MREGWKLKTLGAIAEFRGGGTPSTEKPQYWEGDIPWVSPKDMKSDEVGTSIDKITMEAIAESATSLIPAGSILIVVRSGILARTIPIALTTCDLTVNQDIKALCPNKHVDSRYLLYFMRGAEKDILKLVTRGATVHRLSTESIKALPIPVPPLAEQKRIVAILDEAFEGIAAAKANAEKNLANARELFEGYLNSVFAQRGDGWIDCKLGDISKTQYGLSEKMNEDGNGFKIFRMGEVQNGHLIDTGLMKRAAISRSEFEKYKLHIGDVLFNRTNSYELVGKTGIFTLEGDYCFASYLVRLNCDRNKVVPNFLNYLLNSSNFQQNIKQKASRSINQANINATILSNENICLPLSISEQESIARKLDVLSGDTKHLASIYQQKLAALAELKQSVLQKAFAGELTSSTAQTLPDAAE